MPRRHPATEELLPREVEYLHYLAEGLTKQQMNRRMGAGPKVANYLSERVAMKLGARTAAHAVHLAYVRGILTVPDPEPRVLVPAGPTHEAFHRMLVAGWPVARQAREAGLSAAAMHRLLVREVVLAETEERVLATAERLLRLDPVEYGVDPRVVARARNEARRRGWSAADAA